MPSFDDNVNTIVDFMKPKDIILFAGSGASIDAHLPGWDTLADKLRDSLASREIPIDGRDIFALADSAKQNSNEYYEILWNAFRNPLVEPGELDEHLASLRPYFKFIVTSNYDKLLETAFRTIRLGIDPPVTTKLEVAKALCRRGKFFIYKFNGDIDDEKSIVLGQKDYARQNYGKLFSFLSTFKIFYVAYGFRDRILEHYRTKVVQSKRAWKKDALIMMQKGPDAEALLTDGYRVVMFADFEEQKRILQHVSAALVQNPFRDVHKRIFKSAAEMTTNRLFANVRDSVRAVAGRMLILHENWEFGWDVDDFRFERIGNHQLPTEAQKIVDQYSHEIERPWWGKLAYMGLVLPLTERKGVIYCANTSFKNYMLLWIKLDEKGLVPDSTPRERFWQFDIKKHFEASELPHILCMHLAVISSDGKLLLTRKSDKVAFERKSWCPSIEEQVSDGNGEASQKEIQELINKSNSPKPVDESPKATCLRGLDEELRISRIWVDNIRFYAFCTDWKYSEVAVIGVVFLNVEDSEVNARFGGEDMGEFQVDPKRWIQYTWTPARVDNLARLVMSSEFGDSPESRGVWHASAKLRLLAVMAAMVQRKWATWAEWNEATL